VAQRPGKQKGLSEGGTSKNNIPQNRSNVNGLNVSGLSDAQLQKAARLYERALRKSREQSVDSKSHMMLKTGKFGKQYWHIETEKDVFKNITNPWTMQQRAYDYIIGKRDNKETITDVVDGKEIQFIRLSAEEFTRSDESQLLFKSFSEDDKRFNQKMRLAPSIQDLIDNSVAHWDSPDVKNHKLFKENGFRNYNGRVRIDNVIFKYIVRLGKANFGEVFYDINLEVDSYLPRSKNAVSDIKKESTSDLNIPQNIINVNKKTDVGSQVPNVDKINPQLTSETPLVSSSVVVSITYLL